MLKGVAKPKVVELPKELEPRVQLFKACPPVVKAKLKGEVSVVVEILEVALPVTVPLVPPIAPVNVTKLLAPVGNTNAPTVNVVTPDITSVLFDIVVPVVAPGLLIVNAAIVAGNKAPVTCDAVALLKVKLVVIGNVLVPVVVSVPFIPNVFAVVKEPDAVCV